MPLAVKYRLSLPTLPGLLVGLAALSAGAAGMVQAAPLPPTLPKPSPVIMASASSSEFPLETGDILAVTVANHPEMNSTALVVNENGKIALPIVGNLAVAGKSVPVAQKLITAAYATQLRSPQVSVILVQPKPRRITLVGAVAKAGQLDLSPGWRITDAIDAAGGLALAEEDLIATITRGQGKPQSLDLTKIEASPQDSANIALRAGDTLSFKPFPGRQIIITGDVKAPGAVTLRRRVRLLDAIAGVGGLIQKPETTQINLIRGDKKIPIDMVGAFEDRDPKANIELLGGDALTVQAIRTAVAVVSFNELVKSTGNYNLEGKADVLDVLLAAGGLTVEPDQVVASIHRGSEKIPVDILKATYDPAFDVPLVSGDILMVSPPEGPTVKVAGGVAKPGQISLKKEGTLLDAIFLAGGLSAKPDDTRISILRNIPGRQLVLNVDPVALIGLRDLSQNVRLVDGDLVMVNPEAAHTVFISGEVVKPNPYQLKETDGLVELLLQAGGPTQAAALTQLRVVHRDGTAVTVDASDALNSTGPRLSFPLQDGDLVVVPRNEKRVLVMNAVNRPGYVAIPEKGSLTIGDALLMAGGPRDRARLQEVAILRQTANGEVIKTLVPVNQVAEGKLTINVPLMAGDIVYVPEGKTNASALNRLTTGMGALSIFRTVIGP